MSPSWLSLIPPLVVISSALVFRHINTAFLLGIASAGLVAMNGSIPGALALGSSRLLETGADFNTICLFAFLITIGSLIILFGQTGCVAALTNIAVNKLKTKKSAQKSSIALSMLLFVDDYLSILTTGHVIRSITDRFGIPREKIAFLIHSLAGSVVILVPISSWVAAITAQLSQAGVAPIGSKGAHIAADPFFIYLQTLPFMFYSFLIIGSVLFIVHKNISFGPMHACEQLAHKDSTIAPQHEQSVSKLIDLAIPLATLLLGMIVGLLYAGEFYIFGGNRSLVEALKHNDNPFLVMFTVGAIALAIGILLAIKRGTYSVSKLPRTILGGTHLMLGAILMIFFSSTLATMLKGDVMTGQYLADTLIGSVSTMLLPALFFIVSLICALVTGSAWGTFSLMLSIAVPMVASLFGTLPVAPENAVLLLPVLGAIFSGAVCGDHISPISETTIMSAGSTDIQPFEHTYTQLPYALPAAICSLLAFVASGFLIQKSILLAIAAPLIGGLIVCCATLKMLSKS